MADKTTTIATAAPVTPAPVTAAPAAPEAGKPGRKKGTPSKPRPTRPDVVILTDKCVRLLVDSPPELQALVLQSVQIQLTVWNNSKVVVAATPALPST